MQIHPGKLTWNLKITHLKRRNIFQTFICGYPAVSFRGCNFLKFRCFFPSNLFIFQLCRPSDPEFHGRRGTATCWDILVKRSNRPPNRKEFSKEPIRNSTNKGHQNRILLSQWTLKKSLNFIFPTKYVIPKSLKG